MFSPIFGIFWLFLVNLGEHDPSAVPQRLSDSSSLRGPSDIFVPQRPWQVEHRQWSSVHRCLHGENIENPCGENMARQRRNVRRSPQIVGFSQTNGI